MRREGGGKPVQTLKVSYDGIVSSIAITQGDRVQPGASVHQQRLVGAPVLIGQVIRIDAVLNPKTRLIDADISVAAGSVLSGEVFRATVTTGQIRGWLVPHEAVLTDEKGAFLFQANTGQAARVDVTVVGGAGDLDAVQGPIDPARPIIVQGSPQLSDGAAIRDAKP